MSWALGGLQAPARLGRAGTSLQLWVPHLFPSLLTAQEPQDEDRKPQRALSPAARARAALPRVL